jgi:FKBP-type peptidyl-prolyl cis-trans isomerase SlyD
MKIAANSVVSIEYVLRDDEGDVIDSSEGDEPLAYIHGHEQIVPGTGFATLLWIKRNRD